MKIFKILYSLSLAITLFACSDDEPSSRFSGITETDVQGEQIGAIDQTDWQHNDIWSNEEMSLFAGYENLNNEGITEGTSSAVWYAFPNPTNGQVIIHMDNLEDLEFAEWKLVKNNFSKVTGNSFSKAPGALQLDLGSLVNPGIYRMYYLYKMTNNEYIFKGHGDIQLTE